MKTLEKRLFHLFAPADVARARGITPQSVSCPRVGQVRATVDDAEGMPQEVILELSAHRRGGMTLESRCTTTAGRAGRPCAVLAAVLLEVDRRGLLKGIHDQTPVTLDIVAETPADEGGEVEHDEPAPVVPGVVRVRRRTVAGLDGPRLPPWAAELEERRRLVEPAVRSLGVEIPDARKAGGTLVFLLDAAASAEARAAVLRPCRMQLDVAGNATGRPKPIELGPGAVELGDLDRQEREILERLLGAAGAEERSLPTPLERRSIARIVISPRSAAAHVALLCETGRLVVQPEPRRAPDDVVPLAWDGGRPWELAFVVGPDDNDLPRRSRTDDEEESPPRPAKATLTAALVRGSQCKSLREPRAILKAGIVVFADRIARLEAGDAAGWIDQFERRGPIELSSAHCDGLIERLALLADLPRVVLPAWTGWRIESGAPRPKLILDDSPAISADDGADGPRRRGQPRVHLAGRVWFDYAGVLIAADDPAGGAADADRRVLVRRDRAAEREALAALTRHGFGAARG
ncbi:MAG: hypothetical protein FJ284_04845, partial [Planctomycetes bacterium]|nr:hypothetical protein [Planctomycetota bacterium]